MMKKKQISKDSSYQKSKWILYKLSRRDDKKLWHELHTKNNQLRHVNTKIPDTKSNQCTSSFRSQGHKFNITSNISPYVSLLSSSSDCWHGSGRSFSQLPRFRKSSSLSSNMTYQEALGVSDPLQNKFVSKHTKNNRKCKLSKSHTLSSLNTIRIKAIDTPSAMFVSPERSELFDLDKITREHEFDQIDTESIIFATNSKYWLRDNAGFTMNIVPKLKERKSIQTDNDDASNEQNKLPKLVKNVNKHTQKRQQIANEDHKHKKQRLKIKVDSRQLQVANKSSSKSNSNRLSTISASPSTARSIKTSSSSVMNSPLLTVKIRERTPINHKMLKKYLYKNIFDKRKMPEDKIYVLGSNSIVSQL